MPLELLGFRKRAGQIYTFDLGDDVLGWVGLNKSSQHRQPGQIEVNPVIGVRHQRVERAVADLLGQKFHDYRPPTVSCPLGYLTPEGKYTAWIIGEGSSVEAPNDLASAVHRIAIPWMRSLRGLPELRGALEARLGHQPEFRLPVVLAIAGKRAAAHAALQLTLEQLGTRTDPAAEMFKKFAESFSRSESLSR